MFRTHRLGGIAPVATPSCVCFRTYRLGRVTPVATPSCVSFWNLPAVRRRTSSNAILCPFLEPTGWAASHQRNLLPVFGTYSYRLGGVAPVATPSCVCFWNLPVGRRRTSSTSPCPPGSLRSFASPTTTGCSSGSATGEMVRSFPKPTFHVDGSGSDF